MERLMGSNEVSLTDRNYMQKLQHRISEDYADSMEKMIKVREVLLYMQYMSKSVDSINTYFVNKKIYTHMKDYP